MIIDCHGHFTSEPPRFRAQRAAQIEAARHGADEVVAFDAISDDTLRAIVADNQLRLQQERGTDVTLLSPRAAGMGHHVPGQERATDWARRSNTLVERIAALFPGNFAAVCQLPQVPGGRIDPLIAELERCADLGFVGCNVNPDPSGGRWDAPPVTDPWWDPLWGALESLRMPAMLHVSASDRPGVHTTGAHYLAADTIVFMQLLDGQLFRRHPDLRLVIPHGGGAAPFHWGRYRGLAMKAGDDGTLSDPLRNVYFDTCVYHQAGIDLLVDVVGPDNLLFGSELLGAVTEIDPATGHPFDDTRRYLERAPLDDSQRARIFEGNARLVYPRLDERLSAQGRPAQEGAHA